jgi:S-adenosylmethionine-dependent methyltransferase
VPASPDVDDAPPRKGSRLDSFIRRLEAQRACLDWAAAAIADVPGAVVELGLGNGRTYDHLRTRLGGRAIFAFDRHIAAHPACIPDAAHMIVGDFRATLAPFAARHAGAVALVHADTGSGDEAATAAQARWLGPVLAPMLAQGAIVLSDQPLEIVRAVQQALPRGVQPGRYFIYRAG